MLTSMITSDIALIAIISLGLILLILEFIVPSFGVLGLAGLYLTIESVLALKNFSNYYIHIFISVIIAISFAYILYIKIFKKNSDLVLKQSLSSFKGNKSSNLIKDLAGKRGYVVKVLKPAGKIEIDGEVYSAVSDGDYISKDSEVWVSRVENSQVYCKEVK